MNEKAKEDQEEIVDFQDLDECLKVSVDSLKKVFKDRNEKLREIYRQIELIKISQKKLPDLLEQAKGLTREINIVAKDIPKLEQLNQERENLKDAIENVLVAMETKAEKLNDDVLKHEVKGHRRRFLTAIKMTSGR